MSTVATCRFCLAFVYTASLSFVASAQPPTEISDRQFVLDSGLQPGEVGMLARTQRDSHYRMRLYRFTVDEVQAERLRLSLQPAERSDSQWLLGVARLVSLAQNYLPERNKPLRWVDLVPPYSTQMMQCFKTNSPDFGFRYLQLSPSRAGKRTAVLALGQQKLQQAPHPCKQSVDELGRTGLATFVLMQLGSDALPYPFARRVLAEKLLLDYQPNYLDFQALIFVDSSFWFRFSASRAQFETLVRRFDLRVPDFAGDESAHAPAWFKPANRLRTRCWQDENGNSAQISAYWQAGMTFARVSGNLIRWHKPCPANQ